MNKILSLFLLTIGLTFAQPGIVKPSGSGTPVSGPSASGSPLIGAPVRIGLSDGTNTRDWVVVNGQGDANAGSSFPPIVPWAFNGSAYDRERTVSLANMPTAQTKTATNSMGAQLIEKGARWSVVSNPASGSQATASLAAEASVRHVIDCISFAADSSAAVTGTSLTVNIRDGATGAGTIIYTWVIGVPTVASGIQQEVSPHSICGLNLTGTTNTAMTAEFSAGLTGLVESISFTGFNVN